MGDLFGSACDNKMPALDSRGGTKVDQEISRLHRIDVMFDDDDGVSQVPEPGEGVDQLVVVPLVESDRRFVKDIEDSHESGAYLRGQSNPLRLAA